MKIVQSYLLILSMILSSNLIAAESYNLENGTQENKEVDLTLATNPKEFELSKLKTEKKLTLFDLRIPEKDYTSEMQEVREKKLHGHQHLALLTLGLAAVSAVTAVIATNKMKDARAARNGVMNSTDGDKFNLHALTAGVTLASYLTTAYFSISAPKADTMVDTENVKWHKRLAYIHMPAMIIGPILGMKAIDDYKKGKNPSGIAKLHKPIMALGIAALAGAAIVVEF